MRWIESSHHVFYDAQGAPLRTVGAVMDITERKRSEETLKLGEERLNLALKAGAIGTFDLDIPTGKHFLTEKACAIFGLPLSKSTSAYEDWRRCIHPGDVSDCEAKIRDAYEHRFEEFSVRYRILRADTGELRWIESRHRAFYDAQGAPLRTVGVAWILQIAFWPKRRYGIARRASANSQTPCRRSLTPAVLTEWMITRISGGTSIRASPWDKSIGDAWTGALHPDDSESTLLQWMEFGKDRPAI